MTTDDAPGCGWAMLKAAALAFAIGAGVSWAIALVLA